MASLSQTRRSSGAGPKPAGVKPAAARKPALTRRPAYMQAKLAVSRPQDSQEQEADRVAEQVSRRPRALQRTADTPADTVERASLEPGITPEKKEESLAPSPVPAAEQIEAQPPEEQTQTRLEGQPDEDEAVRRQPTPEAAAAQSTDQPEAAEEHAEPLQTRLRRQAAEGEEEGVQTRLSRQGTDETEESIQARLLRQATEQEATAGTRPRGEILPGEDLDEETEQRIARVRGQGDPLPEDVRRDMEQQLGRDLEAVRVHTDAEAGELCARVNARAFTVGQDIFFAPGQLAPETEQGRNLLAHELTHVLQQRNGVTRRLARANGTGTPAATPAERAQQRGASLNGNELSHPQIGAMDRSRHWVTLRRLDLPAVKKPLTPQSFQIPPGRQRGDTQSADWDAAVNASGIDTKLGEMLADAPDMRVGSERAYYLRLRREQQYVIGSRQAILGQVKKPVWNRRGQFRSFDVDHKREFQLGGEDDITNYWLLESSANRSSGAKINNELNRKIDDVLGLGRFVWSPHTVRSSAANVRSSDTVEVEHHGADLPVAGHPEDRWELGQINAGTHLEGLEVLSERQIRSRNLQGSPGRVVIYSNEQGGRPASIEWGDGVERVQLGRDPGWGFTGRDADAGIRVTEVNYREGGTGTVSGFAYSRNKYLLGQPFSWSIVPMAGVVHGGAISQASVQSWVRNRLRAKGFSPVEIDEGHLEAGTGLVAHGRIVSDLPILQGAEIGLDVLGDGVELSASIPVESIKLPPPVTVTYSSVRLFAGTRGFGAEGEAGFEIRGAGEGQLTAGISSEQGFNAEGSFTFDTDLFTEAEIRAWYREEAFGAEGRLAIGEGKVPGIRSASVTARYEQESIQAEGTVEPNVPGVQSGNLQISYSEAEGLAIGGRLTLSSEVPGIRGGEISARLTEREDGGYAISASGDAQPDIPGIDSNLHVEYDDGAFTAEFSGNYRRGMLSGQVSAGVTNRAVGEDGRPSSPAAPDAPLIVYGSGSVTVQIAPWLQGTVGIRFDPNGEVTVSGEIALPSQLEIFPRKEVDKSIFNVAVQVPIVPGIVAEIGGGLSAQAGIGPGAIDQLRLRIEYNPAHEENTHVTGDAHLNVPADAGLRLAARAGIGLGITGASATGGLEVGGTLGISGAAEAGVHIDWTPSTGLDIRATVAVHAQPSFTFDVSGYVSVRALGFSVYDNRWELASFTYGSDYRFGIRLPIHYHEGEPFDIALSDVEFEVPNINTSQLLRGLIGRIA